MTQPAPLGLSDLVRRAAGSQPSKTALVDAGGRVSWAELDAETTRAALALLGTGPDPGDRVAFTLGTGIDFAVLYLGALRAGLIAVPINPSYTPREVEHILLDCAVTLQIGPAAAHELREHAPHGEDPRLDRTGEAAAVLLYTSGTSGRPRGAILSTRALLANLDQLAAIEPPVLTADDVLFVPLPLSHVFGLNAGLGMGLRVGASTVLADRFDPAATLAAIAAERVTAVVAVPGQYAAWLAQPNVAEAFASVRFAMSGSATLTQAVVDGFAEFGVVLHDGYGLTEAAPVVSVNAIGAAREHPVPGSIGRPIPGVEVQLRDPDGSVLAADDGDPGRLFVRGANLFSGYWPLGGTGSSPAGEAGGVAGEDGPDPDGWFGTGDVAVRDEDGALRLVGRSAELVVVNGFNVYPAEVESVLAAEPGVAEVAVVGMPDESTGESVRAYVVPAPGTTLRPDELLAAAARSLARFKLPSAIEVVASLPRTVTGKVMKWAIGPEADDRGRG